MSFRVTLSDVPAPILTTSTQKRRIYRWGDMWGILTGSDWLVERRTLLSTTPMVEAVERLEIQAPPPRVDDIWEEEVVLGDGTEWNSLLSFTGTTHAVQSWYVKTTGKRLDVPLWDSELARGLTPCANTRFAHVYSEPLPKKQERMKVSKCLIVDA